MKRLPATQSRETIRSSEPFLAYVENERLASQRRRDDALQSISAKRTDKQRAIADHETRMMEFDAEIAELQSAVQDEEVVIDAAERALTLDRPAPQLSPHTEVADAMGGEK